MKTDEQRKVPKRQFKRKARLRSSPRKHAKENKAKLQVGEISVPNQRPKNIKNQESDR